MRLTILGGGGFRVPLVYGALLARPRRGPGRPRSSCTTWTRAGSPRSARSSPSRRRPCPSAPDGDRHHRPRRGAARRRLRLLRDPRRRPGGPRGRRAGRPRRGRPRPGDGRRGRHRLRPAHRPGRRGHRPARRPRSPPTPGSSTSPTRRAWSPRPCPGTSATASSASATPRSASAAGSPGCSAPTRTEAWIDYVGLNHLGWVRGLLIAGGDDDCRACSPTPTCSAPSRRASSSAPTGSVPRRDPQRVPALLLLQPRGGRAYQQAETDPRRLPRRPAGALLRRGGRAPVAPALDDVGPHAAEREATYMAENRDDGGRRNATPTTGRRRLREGRPRPDAGHRPRRAHHPDPQRPQPARPCGARPDAVIEVPCLVDANGAHPLGGQPADRPTLGLVRRSRRSSS